MKKQRLQFHIQANDYFGTIATVLDLLRQALEKRTTRPQHVRLLARLTKQLLYLQQNFMIQERDNTSR